MIFAEGSEEHRTPRVLRRVTSREEQDRENMRYWRSVTSAERLSTAFELTRSAYLSKGYDAESLERSDRTLTRVQRAPR